MTVSAQLIEFNQRKITVERVTDLKITGFCRACLDKTLVVQLPNRCL